MKLRGRFLLPLISLLFAGMEATAAEELSGVRTIVEPTATTFQLELSVPVEYFTSRIGSNLYLVDVAGVSTQRSAESQMVQSPLVSSYRLLNYEGADETPHLALEITLKGKAEVQARQNDEGLEIQVQEPDSKAPATVAEAKPADAGPKLTDADPEPSAVPAADATPKGEPPVSIREISVVQPPDGSELEVEIVGDKSLANYRTFQLRNPERLVVDIPNSINRIRQRRLAIEVPPLRAVRVAQFRRRPLISRVVMDLDSRVPFHVRRGSQTLVVILGEKETGEARKQTEKRPVASSSATRRSEPEEKQRSSSFSLPNPFAPRLTLPATVNASRATASNAAKELSPPVSPAKEENDFPEVSTAHTAAVRSARETREAAVAAVRAQATEKETAPRTASEEPTVLLAQQTTPAPMVPGMPQQAPAQQEQPVYTGEPISLDLKDVDLRDFFRLIHEISGLNIVLDPGVSGTVTIVLDEVPWDQAMDIVLRNNRLGKEVVGNVVRVAELSTLQGEEEQRRDLARAIEESQPRETVTRTLSYARAADLVPTLKRFLSARGDIVPDARTNTLIITDIPGVLDGLDGLIGQLDRKSQQVEIEARVVAASRSFARDIGTQLAASGATGNVVLGGTGLVGESPILRGTVPPLFIGEPPAPTEPGAVPQFASVAQPLVTNFPAVGATSGTSFLITGGNFALDAIITAAERRGVGKLLSRPKVITQNNVEAEVKQGVRIPLQTTINNTISVQFVDVVLRLTVTPQITADGTIFLTTDVENTGINPGIARIQGVPALDTQQATTKVLVSNGGTVFFGGVIQTQNNLTEEQVPLLGSIPLVGHLFRRTATTTETNELLFFITPRIVQS